MTKTFAIGDMHGRYDLFNKVINFLNQNYDGGKLVILGDMIDRGPQSKELISKLMGGPHNPDKWEWITLMGNHESMMLASLGSDDVYRWWCSNGGETTVKSYGGLLKNIPEDHIKWIMDLPTYYTDDFRFFVHAGVNTNKSLSEQSDDIMQWIRYDDNDNRGFGDYHVVHGHTPRSNPLLTSGRTCLDVNSCNSNWVALAEFDDDKKGGPVTVHEIK